MGILASSLGFWTISSSASSPALPAPAARGSFIGFHSSLSVASPRPCGTPQGCTGCCAAYIKQITLANGYVQYTCCHNNYFFTADRKLLVTYRSLCARAKNQIARRFILLLINDSEICKFPADILMEVKWRR